MMRKDSAVSPVIGVLLMLVVTLIIAAIVSGFAGGLASDQEKAPQLSVEIKTGYGTNTFGTASNYETYDISFKHLGGDTIATKDVAIVTKFTGSDGTIWTHRQTKDSSPSLYGTTDGGRYAKVPYNYDTARYPDFYRTATQINDGDDKLPCWWGQTSFGPGQVLRTYNINSTAYLLGLISDDEAFEQDLSVPLTGTEYLRSNISNQAKVEIQWIHIPSDKIILDKTITLGR